MASTEKDSPGMEVPSHRACAHCRSQKVRCIMDDDKAESCQRCARSGRPCVFTPLQKRKQRKRTDTRVAELEREMRVMRTMLKNKNKDQAGGSENARKVTPAQQPAGLWFVENIPGAPAQSLEENATQSKEINATHFYDTRPSEKPGGPTLWPDKFTTRPLDDEKDIVERGIISMATARHLFDTYRKDLFPHFPTVFIPESTSADELRQTKPTLFLAVVASAAAKDHGDLSARLDQEILQAYATKSMVHSEKSLELVQSLILSAIWYHPPNKFGQLKYYEYIHMATTMAMDIGIGTRHVPHRSNFGPYRETNKSSVHPLEDAKNPDLSMTPRSRTSSPDTSNLESRRTFLACYIICTTVSMSLRRPNMLRASTYLRDCVEFLERSPQAIATDRQVVAWVRLLMIGEEISTSFSYDDPGGIACITELRTQIMLKDFSKRLDAWFHAVSNTDMNGNLQIMYYNIRLNLHELALHVDHSPADFKAPYQMGVIHPWDGDEIPTQILAEAIAECISSSHNLMNTFLSMDVENLRALPVFSYVRVSFAAFVLAKLCLSAAHPGSRVGQVLDRTSLKAESFMDRAILHVRAIVGPVRCRIPAIFLALLFKLRQWCLNPEMIERSDEQANAPAIEFGEKVENNLQLQSHSTKAIEGPRITEQGSGDESSPQTSMDSHAGWYDNDRLGAGTAMGHPTPDSHVADHNSDNAPHFKISLPEVQPTSEAIAGLNPPQLTPFLNPNDQMELDQNFFQFFGDMNGLSEGGLTGLEDWSSIPTDFIGLGNSNFDWQTNNPVGYGSGTM